jgi:hypothetical protein
MTFSLLLKRENTRHEELENDQSPEESVECDSPCFPIGFVWLEVDCLSAFDLLSPLELNLLNRSLYLNTKSIISTAIDTIS